MPPRPIWSGTISFGLVTIPVRMFTATSSRELHFHFVDRRDLQPIGYDKVRKDTGEHVDDENIVRAFELEKGRYVPVESEDLDRLDVGIAKVVIRNKQHLACLRPHQPSSSPSATTTTTARSCST